ncbi:leucine rich repeat family protein [Escherichia coli]|uniref:leucine rich repeat family protein n=1 Tax=Escherichia coli TaxID=562 RepID=UPI000543AD8B|nr:leucine rich repeat family protein [Escherichia coli]KHG99541.1 leucine rich repeat family protein [Escherichia coli]
MASFKDICPFAPAIPPSSVNTGVRRPPGRLFLSVELKNQILQNMKYLSPQKFSWGDAPWQIIDLSIAGKVNIQVDNNTIITLETPLNQQHNEFMMVAKWCEWAIQQDSLQENLQKNLYKILEENQQNKLSEIPQEDLKERLKEIKEDILEENQSASQIEDRAEALRRMKECLITRQSMLDLSNLGLTSLPENLPPHLIEFNCSRNVLTALPEVMPKGLRVLECMENFLILLPKVQPPKLMVLKCYENYIIWLPELSTNLRVINCSENFLEFLPPSMPQYLYKLSCAGNNINSIPDEVLENLTRLKVFDCSSNDLISSPRLPPKLIIYYCGENQFKTVQVPQPRSLKVFSCNGNPWDKDNLPTLLKAVEGLKNQEGLEDLLDFLRKEGLVDLEGLEKLEDLDDLMDLELLDQQLGLLSLERQQDSQPVNQQSEHEPESASRVKRDLSEVEFESTMKRKRFM